MHGTMEYMARRPERREDIRRWFEPARSVVVLAFSYGARPAQDAAGAPGTGRIAQYARSADYHRTIREKLELLARRLERTLPGARAKAFVDTSAVLERLYGRYAGIGWVGKNTLLVSRRIGSFFFLAGLAVDRELEYDAPEPDHCGGCDRCLRACPTDAFPKPRVLDASRCVAYLTIEHRGEIPEGLRAGVGDWVFGCDVCQDVCPWNRFAARNPLFEPRLPARLPLERLASMTEEEFETGLSDTPLERAGRSGLARNALVALENGRNNVTTQLPPTENSPPHGGRIPDALLLLLLLGFSAAPAAAEAPQRPSKASLHRGGVRSAAPSAKDTPEGLKASTTIPSGLQKPPQEQPFPLSLILRPLERGMFIRLPIVDTDPNRGVTVGVMPIWVLKERGPEGRIRHIHAPSVTHNKIFDVIGTYRYYYYPSKDSTLILRGSVSNVTEREVMGKFEGYDLLGRRIFLSAKAQYDINGSRRFFGIGPDTFRKKESNYLQDTLQYHVAAGLPFLQGYDWNWIASHRLAGDKISNGPINSVPDINAAFPGTAPLHRHQDAEWRLALGFDSRDNPVTASRGSMAELYAETSQRLLLSEYTYQRYGLDLRHFRPNSPDGRYTTAGRLLFEQITGGEVPFWLLPQLGGKYAHRAYGEGRYVDRGLLTASLEERCVLFRADTAGVAVDYELAPFAELGTVFGVPGRISSNHLRPAAGVALRAVARPQVVGSVDFGVGAEGLTAFMDINYSF